MSRELTPEERQKIYEKEMARLEAEEKARERHRARAGFKPATAYFWLCLAICGGALILLVTLTMTGGGERPASTRAVTPSATALIPPGPIPTPGEPVAIFNGHLFLPVPGGECVIGSEDEGERGHPRRVAQVNFYWIDQHEVTNRQFQAFLKDCPEWRRGVPTKHTALNNYLDGWRGLDFPIGKDDHPVTNVSWFAAVAYCEWLSETTGRDIHLPTEEQWEKAARSVDGRVYPWGNGWNATYCNSSESRLRGTTPVGNYPRGASPYGCLDLAGNVWEWCAGPLAPAGVGAEQSAAPELQGGQLRILHGGAWDGSPLNCRSARRMMNVPAVCADAIGFRCVMEGDAANAEGGPATGAAS